MRSMIFGVVGAVVLGGCVAIGDDAGDDRGIVEQASTTANGISINGISINGISINGISINGVSANDGQITGVAADGSSLAGTDLVGATFTASRTDGGTATLRVDDAVVLSGDVWAYHVSQSLDGSTWTPLCTNAIDGRAVVIDGRWDLRSGVAGAGGWIDDPASFTFGCRQAAIAKCIELGYRPWATTGGVSLRDHHIACVRMIRADYCGDGTAWTQDGNVLNIYDGVGIQSDTEGWTLDALWTKDSAVCSRRTRALLGYPTCVDSMGTCGGAPVFTATTLIADEYSGTNTTSSTGGKVKTAVGK